MTGFNDDRLADAALKSGKATREQIDDARALVARMRELGVERDVLGALVDRRVLNHGEAEELRELAASAAEPAAGGGTVPSGAAGDGAPGDVEPVEDAEEIEEAEAVEEAEPIEEAVGADGGGAAARTKSAPPPALAKQPAAAPQAPPARPPAEVPPAPPPVEAPPPVAVEAGRPSCANHPDQPALFWCKACAKPVCAACVVRTPRGNYCGQDCLLGAGDGERSSFSEVLPSLIKVGVLAAVIGIAAAVVAFLSRPSEELVEARELAARTRELEKQTKPEEALAVARELASMPTEDRKARALVKWGAQRAKAIETRLGQEELAELRRSVDAIAGTDTAALAKLRAEINGVASRFPDVQAVQGGARGLLSIIDERETGARRARDDADRVAVANAAQDAVAEVRAAVQPLLSSKRFAEARLAVEAAREEAGESAHKIFLGGLKKFDATVLLLAARSYAEEDRRAQTLVAKRQYAEARRVYQVVIDTYGFGNLVENARARLGTIAKTEKVSQKTEEDENEEKGRAELTAARRLVGSLEYGAAVERLESASALLGPQAARSETGILHEVIRRERAVLGRIIAMFEAEPVDLKVVGVEPVGGRTQTFTSGDEKSYMVTVKARRGGTSEYSKPWARMPALHLCKLAGLATKDRTVEALIDLSVFCRGHGGIVQGAAAAAEARKAGGAEAKEVLERLSVYPYKPVGSGSRDDRAVVAVAKPAAAPKATPPAEEEVKEKIPKTIEEPCMICMGSGATKELGCAECKATGYKGVAVCGGCGGDGRSPYRCQSCRGAGSVVSDRKAATCGRCRGKGSPRCLACGGSGKTKKLNPAAAGRPTKTCPLCQGAGIDQGEARCGACAGGGKIELKDPMRTVVWVRLVNCNFCDGRGRRPPICRNCMGKGYVRPPGMHGSAKVRATCRPCFGTGQLVRKCRGCAGRGYVTAGK
ncbi:MAG: B-box zinc finger protein [Planctomycetota bacterium]|jgi:hypothetical protein